jgi:hypothetical protein
MEQGDPQEAIDTTQKSEHKHSEKEARHELGRTAQETQEHGWMKENVETASQKVPGKKTKETKPEKRTRQTGCARKHNSIEQELSKRERHKSRTR